MPMNCEGPDTPGILPVVICRALFPPLPWRPTAGTNVFLENRSSQALHKVTTRDANFKPITTFEREVTKQIQFLQRCLQKSQLV